MVELVDTRDLKSLGHRLCRFKPGSGYQNKKAVADLSATAFPFLYLPPTNGRAIPRPMDSPAPAGSSCNRQEQGPASIRDGLENAFYPAGTAMQMQYAGKAVLHLQYGLVPQGQRGAA